MQKLMIYAALISLGFASQAQDIDISYENVLVAALTNNMDMLLVDPEIERVEINPVDIPEVIAKAYIKSEYAYKKVWKTFKIRTNKGVKYELQLGSSDSDLVTIFFNDKGELIK